MLELNLRCKIITLLVVLLCSANLLAEHTCQRIISLAPSTTELLYYLNLGDRVVAVSNYDKYPIEATKKPKIGGLFDINIEAILRLKPDLVLLLSEHRELITKLNKINIKTLTLDHLSVNGIIDSVKIIGRYCNLSYADNIYDKFTSEVASWKEKSKKLKSKKVLVLVSSASEINDEPSLYISGRDGYYSSILEILGSQPLYQGVTQNFNELSYEGLLALQAEIIILILPKDNNNLASKNKLFEKIKKLLPTLPAVKNNNLYSFSSDYMYIPGPRFVKVINDFYQLLNESK
jgi:iron complex transport system substrate-binding protein